MQFGGELAGQAQVRGAGLDPDQVGVRRVGLGPGQHRLDPVANPVEALGGALAGQEGLVDGVDIAGQQIGGERVGAGDDQRGHILACRRPAGRR